MTDDVTIYFKCQGCMYSIMFKKSVGEITLSMIEARILKKVSLDESKVNLQLSYFPLVLGSEEQLTISDDEDLYIYLASGDKENRRSILFVDVITKSELPDQLSRVTGKSSIGKNYEDVEIRDNAMIVYVGEEQAKEQDEAKEDDDGTLGDEHVENGMDTSDMRDQYVEPPPLVESSQFIDAWEDGLGLSVLQEFPSRKTLQEVVDKGAFLNSFGYAIKKSDFTRLVLKCSIGNCQWCLRARVVPNTEIFAIRTYTKMHTCSRADQSTSNHKRKGSAQLVASFLNDKYPGQMETPKPKTIIGLVQREYGVQVSYSTASRGKSIHVCDLRGSPEESYRMLYRYMYVLEQVNPGTITSVELDELGKFKYLFIALGASIEGFQVMRKVITLDATFLKNGYGGVLVFASAQDPNRHHYPIAFGVLDGESTPSWTWFLETLKSVVADSSELVFVSDRNAGLINAIEHVYPQAHHGFCVWHLSQNVKGHASNVNKDVVAWRFMECSRCYTVAEFDSAYSSFTARYPSCAVYLAGDSTKKEKWARCFFPGDRYNLDTSNCVESLNSVFLNARKYNLIPMLDAVVTKISAWFNEHRKDAVTGSVDNKLVPFVENYMHDLWAVAEKLIVMELNSFELQYHVTGSDGKSYGVNLLLKTCTCKFFDIEKYPCVHALAAFVEFRRNGDRSREIELHELCTRYYWTDKWAMAYWRTIKLVPDMSEWNVPDYIKELQIIPPNRPKKKGRKKVKRFPSAGERRPRTQNKRRPRQGLQWLLFGSPNRF